ncbi:MAG: hypothetical protein CBC29_10040 [Methylococcaceae bacterium TMED69]|nr:MAG: hypothetical protein CBC29_10040 [Methylococcaceae bacterium TMED69]
MIKLVGTPLSNYVATVRAALLAKELEFTEIDQMPVQEESHLKSSPMGKVPYIETDRGVLTEVNVIFDYLEDLSPSPALYPKDAWERAKAKEIGRISELYIDGASRPLTKAAYFGETVSEQIKEFCRPEIKKGVHALLRLGSFEDGFITGNELTYSDITTFFQIGFARVCTTKIYNWDFVTENKPIASYLSRLEEITSVRQAAKVMNDSLKSVGII